MQLLSVKKAGIILQLQFNNKFGIIVIQKQNINQ